MDSKITAQSEEVSANTDLAFLSASALAASGKLEEARAMLCQGGQLPSTPQVLDLLARIAIQSGDFVQARNLWQTALKENPSYEPAQKALASLGTPWFALAATKRIAFLALVSIAGCLAFVGLLTLFHLVPSPTPRSTAANRLPSAPEHTATLAQPKPLEPSASVATNDSAEVLRQLKESQELRAEQLNKQIQALQKSQTQFLECQEKMAQQVVGLTTSSQTLSTQQKTSLELAEQTRRELRSLAEAHANDRRPVMNSIAAPAPSPSLNLSVDGISVQPHDGGWEIRFDAAVFDRDDHLKIGSKALIESLAKALVRSQEKLNIQVVGFADNEPPTWPWSKPMSDAHLGQLRADRVTQVLARLLLFPANALSATNGTSGQLLQSGDSRRNRTVVLRISPQP